MWITRKTSVRSWSWGLPASLRIGAHLRLSALALLLLAFAQPLRAGSIHDLANQGDTAYKDGNYLAAIDAYSRVLASGYVSGPLLYNLGNAHFKAGHLARAILFYERAAKRMPHNKDVRYNLDLAHSRTQDRIDSPPRLPIWDWLDSIRDMVAPRTLTLAAWLFALLAALAFALRLVARPLPLRKSLRIGTLVFTGLFVLSIALVGLRIAADHGPAGAIVMSDKVALHSAPDPTSLEVLTLHAGTKVIVVKQLNQWREVKLADGRQGWMPATSCEEI